LATSFPVADTVPRREQDLGTYFPETPSAQHPASRSGWVFLARPLSRVSQFPIDSVPPSLNRPDSRIGLGLVGEDDLRWSPVWSHPRQSPGWAGLGVVVAFDARVGYDYHRVITFFTAAEGTHDASRS
jgi:hypothetical protein